METLSNSELGKIMKEMLSINNTLIQEIEMNTVVISNNFLSIANDKLPKESLLLLRLEVAGESSFTLLNHYVKNSLLCSISESKKHCISEVVVDLPFGHLLMTTPIHLIHKGIEKINLITNLKICDTLGLICRPGKRVFNNEYLKPEINKLNFRGSFDLSNYK